MRSHTQHIDKDEVVNHMVRLNISFLNPKTKINIDVVVEESTYQAWVPGFGYDASAIAGASVGFGSDVGVAGFKISKIGEKEFMQGFNNVEVVSGLG